MITTQGISSSLSSLRELPIGLFDSGVGGMTVLRAMREQTLRTLARECAEKFQVFGVAPAQAAQLLLEMEKEE